MSWPKTSNQKSQVTNGTIIRKGITCKKIPL